LGELVDAKRRMPHKDEEIRQLAERLQRLEEAQERQTREGDGILKEILGIICAIGFKNEIGECTILKNDTINTNNNQRILFIL